MGGLLKLLLNISSKKFLSMILNVILNRCSTQQSCSSQFWITSNGVSGTEQCPSGNIADDNVMISTEDTPYDVRLLC